MVEVSCFLIVWVVCFFFVFLNLFLRCLRFCGCPNCGVSGVFFVFWSFLLNLLLEILLLGNFV